MSTFILCLLVYMCFFLNYSLPCFLGEANSNLAKLASQQALGIHVSSGPGL